MTEHDILAVTQAIQVTLSTEQALSLLQFRDLLALWNERFNLTALTDDASILQLHFADSLTLVPVIQGLERETPFNVIDIGTGGGFPGIPLKIVLPYVHMTLTDGTAKKLQFCEEVIRTLQLNTIHTVHGRAEEMAHQPAHRERYDLVVARAVAPMPTLAEYLLPFAKVGGHVIAMKGSDAHAEAQQALGALNTLGGELIRIVDVKLPNRDDKRALILVRKSRPTPRLYPRQAGGPRKNPLR